MKVFSSKPSSVAMKDEAVKAHRGVERHFVIYCLEINCLLLKPPPCTDYGNSVTGTMIDGWKVALINCFVCQGNLLSLSEMINNMETLIFNAGLHKKCAKCYFGKTYLLD